MRRALFKRQNTITLSLVESQKHISQLLAQLETSHNGSDKDFAYVQANISDLLGKFEDSHNDMQGDLHDILESLQKGTMSNEEMSSLLSTEKERGELTIRIVEDLQKRIDDVLNFVAHFITDVEDGRPLPKESFTVLYTELDTVADSVHAMGTVARTPSRRVREIKSRVLQQHETQYQEERSRGIGGTSSLATFLQTRREQPQPSTRKSRTTRSRERADNDAAGESGVSDRNRMDPRAGSPTTRPSMRPTSSFRALSRQSSLESPDAGLGHDDPDMELKLKGKKSNFSVKGISRQKSGQQTIKSGLVRSLTNEFSDDELSYDSTADNGRAHFKPVKVVQCNRQTQTEERGTPLKSDGADSSGKPLTPRKKSQSKDDRAGQGGTPGRRKSVTEKAGNKSVEAAPVEYGSQSVPHAEQQRHHSSVGVLRSHGQPLQAQAATTAAPSGKEGKGEEGQNTQAVQSAEVNDQALPNRGNAEKKHIAAAKSTPSSSTVTTASKKNEKSSTPISSGKDKGDSKGKSTVEPIKRSDITSMSVALKPRTSSAVLQSPETIMEDRKSLEEVRG